MLHREFAGYNGKALSADLMAGLTVAAVAIPLALAFAVSSGADPASGLITAIVAGVVIGALSGASYQISGPTGAMAAILFSLSLKYGLSGMFFAGMLSGVFLILASFLKLGKLTRFIPAPVITGFTSGIAIIIAAGQIDNFFGVKATGDTLLARIGSYFTNGFSPNWEAVFFGLLVIVIMIIYPKKWNAKFPSSLAGIIVAVILNMIFSFDVGVVGEIPRTLLPEARLTFADIRLSDLGNFIAPGISIAALGMIESLLCGASAGRMKNEKLDADQELLAQGIGNLILPFFGGIPATAAIARTSVAIKSGARTRLASIFHSIGILLSMFLLGPVMSRIPLAALAGVLMVTAWRMNEWHAIRYLFRRRMGSGIAKFLITMCATVVLDLTWAIVIGVAVSILMFVVRCADLTVEISGVESDRLPAGSHVDLTVSEGTQIIYVGGPLFFGSMEKLAAALEQDELKRNLILSMRGVPMMDAGAAQVLYEHVEALHETGRTVSFCGVAPAVRRMLDRAGVTALCGEDAYYWDAVAAMEQTMPAACGPAAEL